MPGSVPLFSLFSYSSSDANLLLLNSSLTIKVHHCFGQILLNFYTRPWQHNTSPLKMTPKRPSKMSPQKDPQYQPHKAQDRADINIIRYLKRVKTECFSSKLVRFSKQISNANILAPVRDNPSKFWLRGSFEDLFLQTNQNNITPISNRVCTTNNLEC